MFIKFDKPKTDSKGKLASSGSSSAFVNYLGKEDEIHIEQGEQPEQWFSNGRDECHPAEVRAAIDSDHQGIGRNEGKFATGSINPTEEEWKALGNTEAERLNNFKSWIQKDFNQEFAGNFKKLNKAGKEVIIEPQNVKMYYKVEYDRYHTGRDQEVKMGLKWQGEPKEGFNVHCHFIVGRKTSDGRNRISPTTNNRKEFDRDRLTLRTEQSFDQKTGYERPLKESYQYMNTMKNGTGLQKAEMLQKAVTAELRPGVLLKIKDLDKLINPEKILLDIGKKVLTMGLNAGSL
ncbi:DUF5712 family protein [Candidatus Oleimmundimicrobium sp.]|uniref:DUF5712 family protein n=1 Tax=Candidatus Oleimmundimicrobium sp. TaxID=3060597 RepID=UPI002721941F|nr:DUF5712 family protein [Candidatus Oleimmundimicrobium sp.]MDO8886191.1 DUF5712 family protein [Candidatus Oleimmundimicrobium sp.]